MQDTRIVYGARCTWWDSIDKIGHVGNHVSNLPACPHCRSVLFEMPSLAIWQKGVDAYADTRSDPDYRDFVAWLRGKCFPNYAAAREAWEAAGKPKGDA